jgi:glucan phosphoethanolaminetransferase (alkaline phosphatase superfamily)
MRSSRDTVAALDRRSRGRGGDRVQRELDFDAMPTVDDGHRASFSHRLSRKFSVRPTAWTAKTRILSLLTVALTLSAVTLGIVTEKKLKGFNPPGTPYNSSPALKASAYLSLALAVLVVLNAFQRKINKPLLILTSLSAVASAAVTTSMINQAQRNDPQVNFKLNDNMSYAIVTMTASLLQAGTLALS